MNHRKASHAGRRLLCIFTAAVLALALAGCGGEKSPYTFKKNSDGSGYICTGASESAGSELAIPDTYRGKPVTGIGSNAFNGRTDLRKITLPDSITEIDAYAFMGCSSLTEINLPNQLETIFIGAFTDCGSLTEFVIPESVSKMYDFTFSGCDSLKTIVVKAPLEALYDRDFFCENLEVIQIPDSVTSFFDTGAQFQYSITDIYYEGTFEQWQSVDTDLFYSEGLTLHCSDATLYWYNGMITGPVWDYIDYDGGWWLGGGILSAADASVTG